ncbi:MAG: hypothetical protein IPO81_22965 [Kouleothrix sp.]|nr:hypothetical protein [Kouleothrix sp.]
MTTKSKPAVSVQPSAVAAFFDILVALFVLAVGCGLWYAGAYFTLDALRTVGIAVKQLDGFEWFIPVGVSLLELRYWPSVKQTQAKTLALLMVGGFDLLSTTYGIFLWFPGRTIPLGLGYTIPRAGLALFVPVVLFSFILTFGPERIIQWAGKEIKRMWGTA